jgi:nucleoside-triphosphatase
MNSHLIKHPIILLTGQPGIGKTTLIKKLAQKAGNEGGGFYTQEVRQAGARIGFEIVTFGGETCWLSRKSRERYFDDEVQFKSYRVNVGGIEKVAVPSLLNARDDGRIIFVDEIGPMEIFSRAFCDAIRALLDDDSVRMIGTIVRRPYRFADEVKKHPRVKIVEVTYGNRDGLAEEIWQKFEE